MIPRERWIWQGSAGHFICADFCRFHLTTIVGPWLVSTIGDYHSVTQIRAKGEEAFEQEEVGCGRKFETMVFVAQKCGRKGCGPHWVMKNGTELDFRGYNTAADATRGHLAFCRKWARKPAKRKRK